MLAKFVIKPTLTVPPLTCLDCMLRARGVAAVLKVMEEIVNPDSKAIIVGFAKFFASGLVRNCWLFCWTSTLAEAFTTDDLSQLKILSSACQKRKPNGRPGTCS